MRNLIILVLVIIALAMVRWLIKDVIHAVKRTLQSGSGNEAGGQHGTRADRPETRQGHMVRDPLSGTYIDQEFAIKDTINGKIFYFESEQNRVAYRKQSSSA